MPDIDEKLQQALIALQDLLPLRHERDIVKLLSRFTSYVSQISAVRQHIQKELRASLSDRKPNDAQRWLDALETDKTFAVVLALRHLDQHGTLVRVGRQHIEVRLAIQVSAFSDSVASSVTSAETRTVTEIQPQNRLLHELLPDNTARNDTQYFYFCDVRLYPKFHTAHQKQRVGRVAGESRQCEAGDDLRDRAVVLRHALQTDIIELSQRSYEVLASSVADAKARRLLL